MDVLYPLERSLRLVLILGLTLLILVGLNVFLPRSQAAGVLLQEDDLVAVARATTVLIGQDLERAQFEAGKISDTVGSGVIIARTKREGEALPVRGVNGTVLQYDYYVLTNQHVVADSGILYGVRTGDGEFYSVNDTDEYHEHYPDHPNIYRFGEDTIDGVEGIDLGVVKFASDRVYPVATLSPSLSVNASGQRILLSGWPVPSATGIQNRVRISLHGQIDEVKLDDENNGGFGMGITNFAASNMSGGPVFDTQGEVVGIYGQGGNIGSRALGRAVPINHFLHLQNDSDYRSKNFPLITPAGGLDPQAIAFGKANAATADNISQEELARGLSAPDMLMGDPAYWAIKFLSENYDCLAAFQDGTYRPALFETRGELVFDVNACLDGITSTVVVQPGDSFYILQDQLEALAAEIALRRERIEALETHIANLRAAYWDLDK